MAFHRAQFLGKTFIYQRYEISALVMVVNNMKNYKTKIDLKDIDRYSHFEQKLGFKCSVFELLTVFENKN